MDGSTVGLVGGAVGTLLGLAGGGLGTYFSIVRTETPERRFMVRMAVAFWAACLVLLGLLGLWLLGAAPAWVYWFAFAAFFVMLGPAIAWSNRRQSALRERS